MKTHYYVDQSILNEKLSPKQEVEMAILESLSINDEFSNDADKTFKSLVNIINTFIKLDLRSCDVICMDDIYDYRGPFSNKITKALNPFISKDKSIYLELINVVLCGFDILKYEFDGSVIFMNNTYEFRFYLYDYPDEKTYKTTSISKINEFDEDNKCLQLTGLSYSGKLLEGELMSKMYHEFFHSFQIPKMEFNLKERELYTIALSLLYYRDPIVRNISYAIYNSTQTEIDANINALYAELMNIDFEDEKEFWNVFNNSSIVKNILYNDKHFLDKESEEDFDLFTENGLRVFSRVIFVKYNVNYKLSKKTFINRLMHCRKYAFSKIGKVITRVADLKGIEICNFSKSLHVY